MVWIQILVIRRKSVPTSNWFFIAREFGESTLWRKANDGTESKTSGKAGGLKM